MSQPFVFDPSIIPLVARYNTRVLVMLASISLPVSALTSVLVDGSLITAAAFPLSAFFVDHVLMLRRIRLRRFGSGCDRPKYKEYLQYRDVSTWQGLCSFFVRT